VYKAGAQSLSASDLAVLRRAFITPPYILYITEVIYITLARQGGLTCEQ